MFGFALSYQIGHAQSRYDQCKATNPVSQDPCLMRAAIIEGDVRVMKALLARNFIDLNDRNEDVTYLELAARQILWQPQSMHFLLENGADPRIEGQGRQPAVFVVVGQSGLIKSESDVEKIEAAFTDLLEHGAVTMTSHNRPIGGEQTLVASVAKMLCRGAQPGALNTQALMNIFTKILENDGVGATAVGGSAPSTSLLMDVVFSDDGAPGVVCPEVVKKLVAAGAYLKQRDSTGWNVTDYASLYVGAYWENNHPVPNSRFCTNNPEWSIDWIAGRNSFERRYTAKMAIQKFLREHNAPPAFLPPNTTHLICKPFT